MTDIERAVKAAEEALNVLCEPGTPEHPNITTVSALANAVARAVLSSVLSDPSDPSEAMVEAALRAWHIELWGHDIHHPSGQSKRAMRAALIAAGKSVEGGE
jgi:hypothetical protein